MKKSSRKVLSILLICIMLVVAFTGCGTKSGEKSSDSGEKAQGEQSEPAKQVTIRYTRWGLPEELNGTKKVIEAFEKANSNIKVELESSSWDQYWERIQTQIASKTAPDAMLMDGGWYLTQFAPKGVLVDIGPLMEKDNISKDDYYDVWATFTYDGKIYALPRDYNSIVLYYNKDLFQKAGITEYPTDDMTWDEAVELAQQLTFDKNGKKPTDPDFDMDNIEQYGLLVPTGNVDATIETLIWQKGGRLFSEDGTQCFVDSPEAREVFQFLYDLTYKYKVAPTYATAQNYGEGAFAAGNFAMVYQGSWLQSTLVDVSFDWDIAVAPTFGVKKVYCAQSVGNSILASSDKQEAAWELVKFMSGPEGQTIMAQSNDSIPVLKSVAEDVYLKHEGKPANKKAIFEEAVSTVPYVDFPLKAKIYDAINNVDSLYFSNQQSLDEMLSSLVSQIKSIQSSGE